MFSTRSDIMSLVTKIVTLILMRRSMPVGTPLLQRLLTGVALVLVIALVASMLLGVWMMGLFYFIYQLLITSNVAPQVAMLSVGTAMLITVIAMFAVAVSYGRRLSKIPPKIVAQEMPVAYRVNNVASAFVDGLMGAKAGK